MTNEDRRDEELKREFRRRRKTRNLALAAVLIALAVLFFSVTIVRIQQGSEQRGDTPLIIRR